MKPAALLVAASLAVNVALFAVIVTRPPAGPAAAPSRDETRSSGFGPAGDVDALQAALASGDAAALAAAGVPGETARELGVGRAFSRYASALRSGRTGTADDGRWWSRTAGTAKMTREQRQALSAAQRQFADALRTAFGNDLGLLGGAGDDTRTSFLPPAKRDALRQIERDYADMMAEFAAPGGVQLASDRERLRLLKAERERDLAALLSPTELSEYEMRSSATAAAIRARYGDAITSEDDFRAIYALQKAFDERFPREAFTGRIPAERLQERAAAERQLQQDLQAALGESKYAALRRAADPDLRTLDSLASRLNLPASAADQVAARRDYYAAESQRISSDPSVPLPQRRNQIQALATTSKAELASALGAEAAEAYAQRSTWVNLLQSGMAFSTNPKDAAGGGLTLGAGQSVFPVMPAGAMPAGAGRQVVNVIAGGAAAGAGAGAGFGAPADAPMHGEAPQVISIIRTETSEPPPANPPPPKP